MRLSIYGDKLISEVQKQFAVTYPFLKVEFFKNCHSRHILHPMHAQFAHNLKLKDAWIRRKAEGDLEINDVMTVTELENTFSEQFGLTAQVFRRSGNIWLETSITNGWTLKQQNDHGREITVGTKPDVKDENDYELNRDAD
jgi:hypothetical protein